MSLFTEAPSRTTWGLISGKTAATRHWAVEAPNRRAAAKASGGSGATRRRLSRRMTTTTWSKCRWSKSGSLMDLGMWSMRSTWLPVGVR